MRFSLSTLIVAVLLIALYLAAARLSTTLAAQAAFTLTVVLFVAGLTWGLFRPGADRRFAIGFQLCGWGYLLLAFSSWSQAQLSGHLLSTHLVAASHTLMPFQSDAVMVEWGGSWWSAEILSRSGGQYFIHYTGYDATSDEWVGPNRIRGQIGSFLQIFHSFLGLIMALAGGVIARCLGETGRAGRWFWIPMGLCAAAVIPCSLVAMIRISDLASSSALSLLLVVLFLTSLVALGPTSERTFATGFAIVGWGYLLLHLGPGLETSFGPHLLTTTLLRQIHEWIHPGTWSAVAPTYPVTNPYSPAVAWSTYTTPAITSVVLAGHALLALLFSLLGGCLALWLSRRKPVGAAAPLAV